MAVEADRGGATSGGERLGSAGGRLAENLLASEAPEGIGSFQKPAVGFRAAVVDNVLVERLVGGGRITIDAGEVAVEIWRRLFQSADSFLEGRKAAAVWKVLPRPDDLLHLFGELVEPIEVIERQLQLLQTLGTFVRARSLSFTDFEDAALASAAEAAGCTQIVSRNVADFAGSPISALTPEELLAVLGDA
ncbi:MAG: hypothetical protein GY719_19140 [bacterium]|nr:hypothetical protein [bacterium]